MATTDYYTYLEDRQCIVSAYETHTDERYIHLHLYNRYADERTSVYDRYYVRISEKYALAERELIFDERQSLTNAYSLEVTERNVAYGQGYVVETDERDSTYNRWFTTTSDRLTHFAFTYGDERTAYFYSKWNTYRYAFAKSWYVSERYAFTYGKPYTSYATQRDAWIQLVESPITERTAYNESCSLSFTLSINPLYSEILVNKEIDEMFQPLFENETVTPYSITYNFVQIEDVIRYADFGFVYYDNGWKTVDIGRHSIIRVMLRQYENTNTYYFMGYFIPIHEDVIIHAYPMCDKFSFINVTELSQCWSVIKEGQTHGYFKLIVDKEYDDFGRKLLITDVGYYPIPFGIYISDEWMKELNISTFNIMVKYGYPMKDIIHRTVFSFMLPLEE